MSPHDGTLLFLGFFVGMFVTLSLWSVRGGK